jgi:NADPH-dependent ferric siderophore reductase
VPELDDPFAQLTGSLAGTVRMRLEVVANDLLTPHMQRLVLTAPELASFSYQPGQDVMLMVAVDGNRPLRRRYTIRDLDPARQRLTMDIVRHGNGPGETWVRAARPGDTIEGIGPRGKIFPAPDADWHLFAADESGLAAVFAMVGALPAGAQAIVALEVPEPADEQPLDAKASVTLRWLHRSAGDGTSAPAGDPERLAAAVSGCRTARATPTFSARPRWCWRCARCWPTGACGRNRSRPRPTGAAARRTPRTASPPGTASAP